MEAPTLVMFSPHPREECVARLEAALDEEKLFALPFPRNPKPFIGRVTANALRLRKRLSYGNTFQTVLSADLESEVNGTALHFGSSRLAPAALLFLKVWFAAVLIIGGTVFTMSLVDLLGNNPRPRTWIGVFGPVYMLGVGVMMRAVGHFLARDEERQIVEFLVQLLDAKVVQHS